MTSAAQHGDKALKHHKRVFILYITLEFLLKFQWLYYTGEFDLDIFGYPVMNISLVPKIVFDYLYRREGKIICLHMERVSCN